MTDLWFMRNRVHIHISGLETEGAFALLEATGPAGDHTPLHVHHLDDEGFYVLNGQLTLWAGDDKHVLRPATASSRRAASRTACASTATRAGS
jgi:quercetin dioxygenase-like cupin family protein